MKSKLILRTCFPLVVLGVIIIIPFVAAHQFQAAAQRTNSISGYIYGVSRSPLSDLIVELSDDFGRMISRTRSNATGSYSFTGLGEGRFTIRVYTLGTDYEEQESSVEISNLTVATSGGSSRTVGFMNETRDIYLKLKRGVTPAAAVIFAQSDIPETASKLYEKAISNLDDKQNVEGIANLKAALEIFPKYFLALERLGIEYIKLKMPETFQASEILFSNAVEVNPKAVKSWYGLAYSQYSLQKNAAALQSINKTLELNSAWPDALLLSGILLRHTQKFVEAEKQLLKAIEMSKGTSPKAHWELALLYANDLNRPAEAAKQLRLFLKLQPDAQDAEKIRRLIADLEAKAVKK